MNKLLIIVAVIFLASCATTGHKQPKISILNSVEDDNFSAIVEMEKKSKQESK